MAALHLVGSAPEPRSFSPAGVAFSGNAPVVEIEIDPDGRLFLDGDAIRFVDLRSTLIARRHACEAAGVLIVGEQLVPWRIAHDDQNEMLIEVLQLSQELRFPRITVQPDRPTDAGDRAW